MKKKIKYLFRRISQMNYRKFFNTVREVHDKTGRSQAFLFLDMIYCGIRYEAGYSDYKLCEFYNLNASQRATFVTRGINNKVVKLLNNPEYTYILDDKVCFNSFFSEYIKRDWLDMKNCGFEAFKLFAENKDAAILKPKDSSCGDGVEKLKKSDFANLNAIYDYISASGKALLEECIVSHPDLSAIYPCAVNTYRIVTILRGGKANILYAFIRIGNFDKAVDNINAGGMAAPIDIETGRIIYPACDKNGKAYDYHPMTGAKITGACLPFWKEACDMCKEAAEKIPEVSYIGWDVAASENGVQFVEGNCFPGHDILQMPPHTPNKIGMLPEFKKYIREL